MKHNGDVPNNVRLFVGGIPQTMDRMEVHQELLLAGVNGVTDVILYKSYFETHRNRGYAFIEFESHFAAAMVRETYIENELRLFNKRVFIDWANPSQDMPRQLMNEVRIIFIRGIKMSMNKDTFKRVLGSIVHNVVFEKVFKDQGHAFIHFFTRKEADRAMALLRAALDGRHAGLEWQIQWATPPTAIMPTPAEARCSICEEVKLMRIAYSVFMYAYA